MGAFDPGLPHRLLPLRNLAAQHCRRAAGQRVCVLEEARRRGQARATVLWVPDPGGPQDFYLRLGFRPTGEKFHGQVVGEKLLD
jgi:diamine N-acetyltransferase